MREGWRPGDIAIDYTYQESWLLTAAGDTADAVRHLDATLNALPTLGVRVIELPFQSAALVRAMALRADIAAQRGERHERRRWAGAVAALWFRADPDLSPVLRRMQEQ